MGDYADFYIDGPGIDPDAPGPWGGFRATKTKPRASVTFTLTKAQKTAYRHLGGAAWVKRLLDESVRVTAQSETPPGKGGVSVNSGT